MKLTNMEALTAQAKLAELGQRDDIPIRASLDIALISNLIDTQCKVYGVVFQNLCRKYSIKIERGEQEGTTQFTCTTEGDEVKQENLEAFVADFNKLLDAKTEDLAFNKIKLPSNITMKPEILKALTEFVEVA